MNNYFCKKKVNLFFLFFLFCEMHFFVYSKKHKKKSLPSVIVSKNIVPVVTSQSSVAIDSDVKSVPIVKKNVVAISAINSQDNDPVVSTTGVQNNSSVISAASNVVNDTVSDSSMDGSYSETSDELSSDALNKKLQSLLINPQAQLSDVLLLLSQLYTLFNDPNFDNGTGNLGYYIQDVVQTLGPLWYQASFQQKNALIPFPIDLQAIDIIKSLPVQAKTNMALVKQTIDMAKNYELFLKQLIIVSPKILLAIDKKGNQPIVFLKQSLQRSLDSLNVLLKS